MLTQRDVEALIVCRIEKTAGTCSSHHIGHVCGQLRALAAVLKDGKPPPPYIDRNLCELLDHCGIPYTFSGGELQWNVEWMEDHGFTIIRNPDGDTTKDKFQHPLLKEAW